MASNAADNVRIDPVNVLWRIEAEEEIDFSTITDFDGTSFNLFEVDGTKAIVAFDLDAVSTLPTPGAGERLIEIDVLTADTLAQKVTKAQVVLDADSLFSASESGTKITTKRSGFGEVLAPTDTDSLATIVVCRRGKDFDLGLLVGDIEFAFEAQTFVVTAHQTGTTPRTALIQGATAEVTTEMQETQTSKMKELYKIYGGAFTPSTSEVFGTGTNKNGSNVLVDAARLTLGSVSATDNLSDITLMLAVPSPGGLVFSGENPRTSSVSWTGYVDDNIDDRVSQVLFGDFTQTGL